MSTLLSMDQYGPHFQIKVISSLLTYKEFLTNIHDVLSEEYFPNNAHKWVIREILNYYDKYHTMPTMGVLKIELQKVTNDVLKISIREQLKLAYEASDEDLIYVQKEFSTFCKNQQLKKALLNSVDLLNSGEYDSIRILIDNALKSGQEKSIGHEYNKDIEIRFRPDSRVIIPTPWDEINELLQGGLGNGDFGLVFASPGAGKSWFLVAIGGFAKLLGYNVIHYTLELSEEYLGSRYDAFFTKIPVDTIKNHRKEVEETLSEIPGELIIKEFPMGRTTISILESHVKKVIDSGIKPDLIIIDYVDLLSTKKKTADRKEEIDDIYVNTKGLARTLDIPIWSVSQVNRAGAKDNIIEGTSAAGSYDKIAITDFCMSLSRKREDKTNGTGRIHIMKNRYGMDGMTYHAEVDTSIGNIIIGEEYEGNNDVEPQSKKSEIDLNYFDKNRLKSKFFEFEKLKN